MALFVTADTSPKADATTLYPSITGAPRSMDENNHVEPFGARKPMRPFDCCSCGGHGKHHAPAALAPSEVENRRLESICRLEQVCQDAEIELVGRHR